VAATGHLPESLVVPVDVSSKRKLVIFVAGTLGTTRLWSHWFFGISEEICRKLDCNGLFLGGEAYAPSEAPVSSITWKSFVPLAQILPHASAIVHHGGIGTAAAAIEHAVPQAIVPRFVWQFSNAEWLRKLGVCVVLQEKDFTVKRGTEELQRLSNDDRYRDRSFQLAQQSNPIDLPSRICKFLETWGKSQSNRSQRQSLGRGAIGA
jgi:rhamnosyltransferase subunit B